MKIAALDTAETGSNADYVVEIKVKNAWFLRRMRAAGFESVVKLARKLKMSSSDIGHYVNLKKAAVDKKGNWREQVHRIADELRCLPEDLFPPQHVEQALKTNKIQMEMSASDVAAMIAQAQTNRSPEQGLLMDEAGATVVKYLEGLPPREERIVRMRFGLDGQEPKTLDQVAAVFGVHRERVRQIEGKALRRMEHRSRFRRDLRDAYETIVQGEAE